MSKPKKEKEAFSDQESIYLLVGVVLYGKRWQQIISRFRDKFLAHRTSCTLRVRYQALTAYRNKTLFDRLLNVAEEIVKNYKNYELKNQIKQCEADINKGNLKSLKI